MSTSLLYHTQGIRGYQHQCYEFSGQTVFQYVSRKPGTFTCSSCKSFNVTATATGEREIKLLPVGSHNLILKVKMHRLRCKDCQAYRMEELPFTPGPHCRHSKAFERTVLELRREMSIKAIATYFNVHWTTVKDIEKKNLKKKYKTISLKDVTAIGIDEVYLGKSLGDKGYLTIVRDLRSGAVLFVGKGKSSETLTPFLKRLKRSNASIEVVAVDMAPSFTAWIKENLSGATIVYDHFHVIKLINDKIDNIRRRTMRNLEEHEKKVLKNKRWHFMRNEENLSPQAKSELDECKAVFEELGISHYLKESLRKIYSIAEDRVTAELAFQRWHDLAVASEIPEMITLAKTFKRNIRGIIAYWETGGITSASMEGFNNKVGWLTRQAYGYRDEEFLILKIYDLPRLKMKSRLTG